MAKDSPPRLAYDLLKQLASEVPKPSWPSTLHGAAKLDEAAVRQNIWLAGQRRLIESLIELYDEDNEQTEEVAADDDEEANTFWTGNNAPRILPANIDVRSQSIGVAKELDAGPDEAVLDHDG